MDYDDPGAGVKRTRGDNEEHDEGMGRRARSGRIDGSRGALGGWIMTDQTGSEEKDNYDDETRKEMQMMARNEEKLENVRMKTSEEDRKTDTREDEDNERDDGDEGERRTNEY